MANRSDPNESLHNQAVAFYAEKYSDEDNIVKAHHPDFDEQPDTLNGEIPDILVINTTKDGGKRAFEIETDASDDKQQRENLREWAENHGKRTFRWGVVDSSPSDIEWRR